MFMTVSAIGGSLRSGVHVSPIARTSQANVVPHTGHRGYASRCRNYPGFRHSHAVCAQSLAVNLRLAYPAKGPASQMDMYLRYAYLRPLLWISRSG